MFNNQQMKYYLIIALIYLASCMNTSKEAVKPVYDEASLRTFVLGTPSLNENSALDSLDKILATASKDSMVFRQTVSFLSEPFSSPNSSYRNQQLYAKILVAKINSNWYNEDEKELAKGKLTLSKQNNIGSAANDFKYTTPAGEEKSMYEIKANFLLLYFNNPECEACKEMKEALSQSAIINQKLKTGELKVLSIYADADKKNWRSHLGDYPKQWLQGITDGTLYKSKVYDLRAIPTMYLMDKDKKVLLKDYFTSQSIEQLVK
jgi:thioredoxin-related protein